MLVNHGDRMNVPSKKIFVISIRTTILLVSTWSLLLDVFLMIHDYFFIKFSIYIYFFVSVF